MDKRLAFVCAICGLAALLTGRPATAQNIQEGRPDITSSVEDIYIARSIRVSHALPTRFCSQPRIGFTVTNEDRFTFSSIATRLSDGRVVDANVQTIGGIRVCIGRTPDPAVMEFYGQGQLGPVSFTGTGACHSIKPNFPEQGLYPLRCSLDLSGLPRGYVGGELTTNTLISRAALGPQTDPPGYLQSSIATIRLWKARHKG